MSEKAPISWLKPKNDFVFKLLFGSNDKTSNVLLLAFLNDVFGVPEGQSLVKVEILNSTLNKESLVDKEAVLDIRARVVGYGYINVEIQLCNQKNIHKRSLYYASKLYEGQLEQGGQYRELTKVIAINLLDFNYFPSQAYRSCYGFRDERTGDVYPDDMMKLYFFEMPKFSRNDRKGEIDKNDRIAKWIRFLTNADDERWEEMAKQDPMLELGVEKLRIASMDPEIRMQYEAREKALKDIASIRGEALEEGIEEGLQKGLQKGREEEKNQLAIKMLKKEMDVLLVMELTGLSLEELVKLREDLRK